MTSTSSPPISGTLTSFTSSSPLLSSRAAGAASRFRWCRCARFTRHFEDHNQRAGRHFITGVHFDPFHGARERRRHFHRGLVAFDGDQRLFSFSTVSPTSSSLQSLQLRHRRYPERGRSFTAAAAGAAAPEPLLFFSSTLAGSVGRTVGGIEIMIAHRSRFVADRDFILSRRQLVEMDFIEALSPSTVISDCSASTLSPT